MTKDPICGMTVDEAVESCLIMIAERIVQLGNTAQGTVRGSAARSLLETAKGDLHSSVTSQKSFEHFSIVHTLTAMVFHRSTLSPLLRLLAAATLLCWLGALALCSTECFEGDSDHQAGHKETASSHSDNDATPDSDNHSGHDDSACDSLKTVVHTANSNHLVKPDFGFCVLSFASLPQALTVAQIEAPVSRQPPNREWIFTPAVYLGPAFRSHAPPVLL